jgi:hypothetical protein
MPHNRIGSLVSTESSPPGPGQPRQVPNPGSDAAIAAGCTCPVLDNGHGAGAGWPDDIGPTFECGPVFWITEDCPLHGSQSAIKAGIPAHHQSAIKGEHHVP